MQMNSPAYDIAYAFGQKIAETKINAEARAKELNNHDKTSGKVYNDKYKHALISCEQSQKGLREAVAIAGGGAKKEVEDLFSGRNNFSESWRDLKADAYGVVKGRFNQKGNCDELVQRKYKKYQK